MNPADYIAVVGLYTKRGEVLAAPGATCERVPATSLAQLLANGDIRPASTTDEAAPRPPARGRGRRKEEE